MVDFVKGHVGDIGIHSMNLAEVHSKFHEKAGLAKAEEMLRLVQVNGIAVIDSVPKAMVSEIGRLKVSYGLGMLDATALATAVWKEAVLVTRDRQAFEGIKKAGLYKVQLY